MQTVRHRIKVFEQHRVSRRPPGTPPGVWETLSETPPVDEAAEAWLAANGHTLVGCSAPSFYFQWMDRDLTVRALIVGVTVTYTEGTHERPTAPGADRPAAPAPGPAAPGPAGGYAPFPG